MNNRHNLAENYCRQHTWTSQTSMVNPL